MKTRAVLPALVGWCVPGLGHIVQRKYARGAAFFVCISGMTALGLLMHGRIFPFQTENPLTILAFFADGGNLLVFGLARLVGFGQGILERATFEYGTAFLAGAGLLNYLVALDAFDIAAGKKP